MAKEMVLAKVTTCDQAGLLHCYGVRAGDMIAQALAMSNGDDVKGVFGPIAPASEVVAQVKPVGGLECLLVLHRFVPDAA